MIEVVMLLGRQGGLECAKEILRHKKRFKIRAIATHRNLPKAEWGLERPEFKDYTEFMWKHGIAKIIVDSDVEQRDMDMLLSYMKYDILISCNWRRKVSPKVLKIAEYGNINIHRGKLPEYAGAEPVKRAIGNRESHITLTAHVMTNKIDSGLILAEYKHPVNRKHFETFAHATKRVLGEINTKYQIPMMEAIDVLTY